MDVTAVHAGNLFINLADLTTAKHSVAVYAWWFIVCGELAHLVVVGLFMISGYLIGGAVLADAQSSRLFLGDYFIHRFARISVILVPALLVTSTLDWTGRSYFAETGLHDSSMFREHFHASLFFVAMVNLQAIYAAFFGTNGRLWSLAREFWRYAPFPLPALHFAVPSAPPRICAPFSTESGKGARPSYLRRPFKDRRPAISIARRPMTRLRSLHRRQSTERYR